MNEIDWHPEMLRVDQHGNFILIGSHQNLNLGALSFEAWTFLPCRPCKLPGFWTRSRQRSQRSCHLLRCCLGSCLTRVGRYDRDFCPLGDRHSKLESWPLQCDFSLVFLTFSFLCCFVLFFFPVLFLSLHFCLLFSCFVFFSSLSLFLLFLFFDFHLCFCLCCFC